VPCRKGGVAIPEAANAERRAQPLRIGILIALLPPDGIGGAEFQAERLARELARRGHEVHLFARGRGTRFVSETRHDGIRIHRRPVVRLRGLRLLVEVLAGGWQASRARADVLLCFMTFNSGLVGYVAHRLGGAPFVIWQRLESEAHMRPVTWLSRLSAWLRARTCENWVQSQRVAATMQREYERAGAAAAWRRIEAHVRVMGNGIDVVSDPDQEVPPPRFVFVGRLVEQKNLFMLLEAARSLTTAEVWIVGSGPLGRELERAAAGAPVRFLGAQPHSEVATLIRQCRALVLCSHDEGLPNVVLEALAAGRPVIATPVGAVPELIEDGVNGRLVGIGDTRGLARAFEDLLDDSTWRRIAGATRNSVARYDWPRLVDRVESALVEIVERT